MSFDDTPHAFSDDAYIARQNWRGNAPILVALGVLDVFLLYQAIQDPGPAIVFALAAFGSATAFAAVLITRSVRRGEVSFAVDAGGVYFGPTGEGAVPELIPWSSIDCIVTFDRITNSGTGQNGRRRCVGVELNDAGVADRMGRLPRPLELPPETPEEQEFKEAVLMPWLSNLIGAPSLVSRDVHGWQLHAERLAEAVMRYAPDTPIARRPTQPAASIGRIAATGWQVHKNLQRRAERKEREDDDQ